MLTLSPSSRTLAGTPSLRHYLLLCGLLLTDSVMLITWENDLALQKLTIGAAGQGTFQLHNNFTSDPHKMENIIMSVN